MMNSTTSPLLLRLLPLVIVMLVGGCLPEDDGHVIGELFPAVQPLNDGERVLVQFGHGQVRTKNLAPWSGIDSVAYPMLIDGRQGPVVAELTGVFLGGMGDMVLPLDTADSGAKLDLVFSGPLDIRVRAYSALVREPASAGRTDSADGWRRAYIIEGRDSTGRFAVRRFKSKSTDTTRVFETLDLRARFDDRSVKVWARHSAVSAGTRAGLGSRLKGCPWDPAMNTVQFQAHSTPNKACLSTRGGEPVNDAAKWQFVGELTTSGVDGLSAIQPSLLIRNHARANEPYIAAWENLTLTGPRASAIPTVIGHGTISALGTGPLTDLTPIDGLAQFSFLATDHSDYSAQRGAFRLRTGKLEIMSLGMGWLLMGPAGVSFGGDAMVNDLRGYRYVTGATVPLDGGPRHLKIEIFGPSNAYTVPVFGTEGTVAPESITIHRP